jgi:hypothetical protein
MGNDELIAKINKIQAKTRRWKLTGDALGVSGGMAFRIAKQGYEPKDNHIRAVLGLPEMLPAPACSKCGRVHVSPRCTEDRQPRQVWVRSFEDGHRGGHYETR